MCDKPLEENFTVAHEAGIPFFSFEDAIRFFGVDPTPDQLLSLTKQLKREKIHNCKNDFILVANFPISILCIQERVDDGLFFPDDWYVGKEFAEFAGNNLHYQLIRKNEVPGSFSKEMDEQEGLLEKDELVPNTQEMVYAIIGHFLKTGERLFEGNIHLRTSDCFENNQIPYFSSQEEQVEVGWFDGDGLEISSDLDIIECPSVGLASAFNPC